MLPEIRQTSAAADLHWLLTSPSLLTPASLPADALAGDAALGEAWWGALDRTALLPGLAALPAVGLGYRLGRYAEDLMRLALIHLPGHDLLASQLAVREAGRSLGEYDFLLRPPAGRVWHIELAVKFYLALPDTQGPFLVGPGLHDALSLKLARLLHHQLQLPHTAAGQAALDGMGPVQAMPWLRGRMFYREPLSPAPAMLATDHLRGWWRCWGEAWPQTRPDSLWCGLPKRLWLAPQQADGDAQSLDGLRAQLAQHFAASARPVMVAEYAPLAAGGQELARGMVLPAGWPEADSLRQLRRKVAETPGAAALGF